MTGFEVVTGSETHNTQSGTTQYFFPEATCPVGKQLVGGGAHSSYPSTQLVYSGPLYSGGQVYNNRWEVEYVIPSTFNANTTVTATAIAYCANVSS